MEGTIPRVYVVHRAIIEKEPLKALQRLADHQFDPLSQVILYEDVELTSTASLEASAEIEQYGNRTVTVEAQADAESILVLADAIYPGWKAFRNGKETEIFRANHFYRAVILPPGKHRVEFRYEPASFKWGLLISSLTILGILGVSIGLMLPKRRERRILMADAVRMPQKSWLKGRAAPRLNL